MPLADKTDQRIVHLPPIGQTLHESAMIFLVPECLGKLRRTPVVVGELQGVAYRPFLDGNVAQFQIGFVVLVAHLAAAFVLATGRGLKYSCPPLYHRLGKSSLSGLSLTLPNGMLGPG